MIIDKGRGVHYPGKVEATDRQFMSLLASRVKPLFLYTTCFRDRFDEVKEWPG
jgi:hypothetical protein